ncbi:MAG: ABC-2 family transporter protein, partial [Oscillospiraceae bacterium]|nr:ABC-2 family transporter protein [Oscillospiraceae bacterium]
PMRDIGELVRSGKFDLYLTRPISPFTYLILQQFQYTFLPCLFFSVFFLQFYFRTGSFLRFFVNSVSDHGFAVYYKKI